MELFSNKWKTENSRLYSATIYKWKHEYVFFIRNTTHVDSSFVTEVFLIVYKLNIDK